MSRHFAYQAGPGRVRTAATAALLLVAGLFAATVASPSEALPPSGGTTTPNVEFLVQPNTGTSNADFLAPDGSNLPAFSSVLAAKGVTSIAATLKLSDGSEFNKGTVINLTPVTLIGTVYTPTGGTFNPPTKIVDSRSTSVPISVTYSPGKNDVKTGVRIMASLKKSATGAAYSDAFDVQDSLKPFQKGDPTLATGIGADDCKSSSPAPLCAFVVLQNDITSTAAALASGTCTTAGCNSDGSPQIQFLAGLNSGVYRADPATLVLRCDKAKCSGKGVSNYTAMVSLLSSGGLFASPPCPAKNTLPPLPATTNPLRPDIGHVCTDYTSSHRDNAGDLLLEVLFDIDMRGTM